MVKYGHIEDAERELENLRSTYLQRWGWTRTCNTPGSFWLWRRDFADMDARSRKWWEDTCARKPPLGNPSEPVPYGVMTVPEDIALSITVRCLDGQPELEEIAGD